METLSKPYLMRFFVQDEDLTTTLMIFFMVYQEQGKDDFYFDTLFSYN
jgi:hypothetical protein